MWNRCLMLFSTFICIAALSACGMPTARAAADGTRSAGDTLKAYRSEAELNQALSRWRGLAGQQRAERRQLGDVGGTMALNSAAPAAAPAALAKSEVAAGAAADSITNVQTAGVDEGGIVKRAGEHLVILRRGRLFTVRVGGDALQPAAMLDAYAPGSNPQGAWYDELLISGSTVVVVGYSYARGGTEIGLFDLGENGSLAYRATYHLRSFDYYSSRNYASRLIGKTLVFYTPTLLHPWGPKPEQMMPGVRRWQGDAAPLEFERILPATRIYRTDDEFDPTQPLALHSVTACDLGNATMRCESTAVLGPQGRVFYVSQGSVYVWTSSWRGRVWPRSARPVAPAPSFSALSAVFRLPLDGTAPSALKTAGVPIDPMSFLEDGGGHLNVLLRDSGAGEGMWGSETTGSAGAPMALLRVPLAAFGDGRGAAQREHYRTLPSVSGHSVQNRFVGDWLLWGGRHVGRNAAVEPGAATPSSAAAWALRYGDKADALALQPKHDVERIEAMGENAVLVGNAGAHLHFSSVRLGRHTPALVGRHVMSGARQGEARTHGFFYRPTSVDAGLLGLPVLGQAVGRRQGVYAGAQGSAAVAFLRQRDLAFTALGELQAQALPPRDDACKASCVDWYGNARPIFLAERVFALLGYELVEGQLSSDGWRERIDERRRISFAPEPGARDGRYSPFN